MFSLLLNLSYDPIFRQSGAVVALTRKSLGWAVLERTAHSRL